MAINRKVRMTGESLAITLPSQIAQLHDIKEGDYLGFTPIGKGEFRINNEGGGYGLVIQNICSIHSIILSSSV